MASTPAPPDGHVPTFQNRILSALPAEELERLLPALELVRLELRQVLVEPNRRIDHIYFPEDGIISIVALMADGSGVEAATVGHEGMLGVPVFLGAMSMAAQAFVQLSGSGYRLPSVVLCEEVRRGGILAALLGRYTQAVFTLVAQSSACNRRHSVDQRCARWLLLTHDRVSGDTFELTHLILAQMLGVRRATVTEVAGRLQAAGLIEYSRGLITIRDRAGLERVSCECYAIIRGEFVRMMEGVDAPDPLDGVRLSEDGMSIVGSPSSEDEADEPEEP